MHLRLLQLGIAAAMVAFATPTAAHGPASAPAKAAALSPATRSAAATVDSFHAALRRGDTRAAAALLADNALIFEEGGAERSKAQYAAEHLPADAEFSKAVGSALTRRAGSSNGNLAWIASEGRTTGTFRGKALDRITTETVLLRRSGQRWKIVHIHWSSAAAKQ